MTTSQTIQTSVFLPFRQAAALRQLAFENTVTFSNLVADAMTEFLKSSDNSAPTTKLHPEDTTMRSLYIPEDLYRSFNKEAKERGCTRTALIQQAVANYVTKQLTPA